MHTDNTTPSAQAKPRPEMSGGTRQGAGKSRTGLYLMSVMASDILAVPLNVSTRKRASSCVRNIASVSVPLCVTTPPCTFPSPLSHVWLYDAASGRTFNSRLGRSYLANM